jgi:LVIVD repeat
MRAASVAVLAAAALALPATAQADQSSNVRVVASIPELRTAISLNFIGNTLFASTVDGVFSYDVSDPAHPRLLDAIPMYIWENEDMDVDPVRKRIFVSRDPRGFTTPATPGAFPVGAVHIIDVSDPANMKQAGLFTLPAGHTSTCINGCDYLWTGGPIPGLDQPGDWHGRPIFGTDVRDPANPKPCPAPIDTGRNDGVTDYAHDVQVDSQGVAWVSGAGGVRGYWTSGRHLNPLSGQDEEATACQPIPYAGSGSPDSATPSRFMHNAWRDPAAPPAAPAPRGATQPSGYPRAHHRLRARDRKHRRRHRHRHRRARFQAAEHTMAERTLYATEENITSDCATSGRFVTYDLQGTFGGEGFRDTATTKNRMHVLDTWTPEHQAGTSGCASSHYFTSRGDGVFANAFYEQGVRFLDVSNPSDIRQVGWYRPDDANTWAAYWHGGLVYVADLARGVDILRFDGGPASRAVSAPVTAARDSGLRFDRNFFGGLCPLVGSPALRPRV